MENWTALYSEALLPPGGAFTRIMTLKQGQYSAPLSCTIEKNPIEILPAPGQTEDYEALSYTWGRETPSKIISFSRFSILLTPNLAAALTRLRHPSLEKKLWVDYICINQRDVAEQDRQMAYMHKIYRGAKKVMAWVGEGTSGSDRVMDYIGKLSAEYIDDALNQQAEWRSSNRVKYPAQHVLDTTDLDWVVDIDTFLSRSWFRRVWIQQEAVMCANTEIWCGTNTVPWEALFAFVWKLSLGGELTATAQGNWRHLSNESKTSIRLIRAIQNMRYCHTPRYSDSRHQKQQPPSLLNVLHTIRLAETPRFENDRIYAVQHLAKGGEAHDLILVPKKGSPWQTVFEELTTGYLTTRGSSILSYSGRAIQSDHNLPSWVADWSFPHRYRLINSKWAAGGSIKHAASVNRVEGRKVLSIHGITVGKIGKLSNIASQLADDRISQLIADERQAYSMIKDKNELNQIEIYARTLVANNPQDYKLDTTSGQDLIEMFKQWRDWLGVTPSETMRNIPKYHVAIENTGTFVCRRVGLTKENWFCLVPAMSKVDDEIVILEGLDRPMVTRKVANYQELIGECYIDGIMEGQSWDGKKSTVMMFT
jgi:hypothetical protein